MVVPVRRAQDEAKSGSGKVYLSEEDPCIVLGYETRFKSEVTPKMTIRLPKSASSLSAEVVEIISDTKMKIKKEFSSDKGPNSALVKDKAGQKGLDYKLMPFIDQQEMYQHVHECLRMGGSIGIFPEGKQLLVSIFSSLKCLY